MPGIGIAAAKHEEPADIQHASRVTTVSDRHEQDDRACMTSKNQESLPGVVVVVVMVVYGKSATTVGGAPSENIASGHYSAFSGALAWISGGSTAVVLDRVLPSEP